MQSISQRSGVGRHRKVNTAQTAKGRIALVTVAAGAVSTAGVGGATAAQIQTAPEDTTKTQTVDFKQRSEEHTSELQSRGHLVCRLLLEKKKLQILTVV